MGYHNDYETRSSFLTVLTNILKERIDFEETSGQLKYYKLLEILFEDDYRIVSCLGEIIPVNEIDEFSRVVVNIMEANDKTIDILKKLIVKEIEETNTANTLFRRNSLITKFLTAYCKMIGSEYLRSVVGPHIKELIQNPIPTEINPSLLPPDQDTTVNKKNLEKIVHMILRDILKTIRNCPKQLREICNFLFHQVKLRFPGSEYSAIAGFVFLRYFCPAFVSPDGFGITDQPIQDKSLQRCLVLVTKILQNLANRCLFTKEPFMFCMNEFLESHINMINRILYNFTLVTFTSRQDREYEFTLNSPSIPIYGSNSNSQSNSKNSLESSTSHSPHSTQSHSPASPVTMFVNSPELSPVSPISPLSPLRGLQEHSQSLSKIKLSETGSNNLSLTEKKYKLNLQPAKSIMNLTGNNQTHTKPVPVTLTPTIMNNTTSLVVTTGNAVSNPSVSASATINKYSKLKMGSSRGSLEELEPPIMQGSRLQSIPSNDSGISEDEKSESEKGNENIDSLLKESDSESESTKKYGEEEEEEDNEVDHMSEEEDLTTIIFTDEQKEEDLLILHHFFYTNMEKFIKYWNNNQQFHPYPLNSMKLMEKLKTILTQLGKPEEIKKKQSNNTGGKMNKILKRTYSSLLHKSNVFQTNIHFEQFMNKMKNVSTDIIRGYNIYYQHGKSKSGLPVFYLICKNFTSQLSMDLFHYYLIMLTKPYIEKKFLLVIDISFFTVENQIPIVWLSNLYTILPHCFSDAIEKIYFININSQFKKYSKRLGKFLSRVMKKFHFLTPANKIFEFIDEKECGLSKEVLSIESTVQSTFSPVIKISEYNKKDVKLMICNDLLKIEIIKTYQLFNYPGIIIVDFIHISSIVDILSDPLKDNNKESNAFFIKYKSAGQSLTIHFVSPSLNQIKQQLFASKDRYNLSQGPSDSLFIKTSNLFRPSDVPGIYPIFLLFSSLFSSFSPSLSFPSFCSLA